MKTMRQTSSGSIESDGRIGTLWIYIDQCAVTFTRVIVKEVLSLGEKLRGSIA